MFHPPFSLQGNPLSKEPDMRTILHVDMDAFFASVEQRDHPEYRGKPVIVGSPPNARGVVSTCSYEARKYGVRSAMPSREAYRLCPQGIFVQGNHARYCEVSRQIMEIFERFTPIIEPLSIDEAYLDVSGATRIFGNGMEIGRKIRETIRKELDLAASVGVGPGKFVAKLCSELAKPDGIKSAPFDMPSLMEFLAPLPVGSLFGVGKASRELLGKFGFHTIGDIQNASAESLRFAVGNHLAEYLRRLAFGEDPSPVNTEREEQSISREHTFGTDCSDPEILRRKLRELTEDVGQRLRKAGKWANTAKLKLRWSDFTTISRQKRFSNSAKDDFTLFEAADEMFRREKLIAPVRLIGFGVTGLTSSHIQEEFDLFGTAEGHNGTERERKEKLSDAIDAIRSKLGQDAVTRLS